MSREQNPGLPERTGPAELPPPELAVLISKLLEDDLTDDDARQLAGALRHDAPSRQAYARQLAVHALLHWQMAAPAEGMPLLGLPQPSLVQRWRAVAWRQFSRPTPLSLSIAAMFITSVVAVLAMVVIRTMRSETEPPSPAIARVTGLDEVRWEKHAGSYAVGGVLRAGDLLALDSGRATLVFEKGTRVVVEGPARGSVDSLLGMSLALGRLVAHVPKQSIGFTVVTPRMEFIDLGTEFGVNVAISGEAEAHVFKGGLAAQRRVAANEKPAERIVLGADQSATFNAQGNLLARTDASRTLFRDSLDRLDQRDPLAIHQTPPGISYRAYQQRVQALGPVAYWQLDESLPSDAVADNASAGSVADVGRHHNMLTFIKPKHAGVKHWAADGNNQPQPCSFDGEDDFIEVPDSADVRLGTSNFTYCCWLRKDTAGRRGMVLGKRLPTGSDFIWLTWEASDLVKLEAHVGGQFVVKLGNQTPLRAGVWYHVAAVVDRNNPAACRMYINGVDDTNFLTSVRPDGAIDIPNGGFYIGKHTTEGLHWDGQLDELAILPAALTVEQVCVLLAPQAP